MTREELLRSMKGPELIKEADKLGVKVKCNKERNKLVEAKSALVDRILAFEAEQSTDNLVEKLKEQYEVEEIEENYTDEEVEHMENATDEEIAEEEEEENALREAEEEIKAIYAEEEAEEVIPPNTLVETPAPEKIEINVIEDVVPTPKRGALIEWNGKAQNICKWGEELGISPNTLYGRIYKLGWTVDKAFTTKGRK